jgi:hypothetical protein
MRPNILHLRLASAGDPPAQPDASPSCGAPGPDITWTGGSLSRGPGRWQHCALRSRVADTAGGAAMSRTDRVIRWTTVAAVAAVGLAAAVLSYRHQFELAAGHGESALTAKLLPISIDGLLLAGTLAVLDASRRQTGHACAARITVGLGVAMTMWANIVHGIGYGWTGVIISGWPPVALAAAIEVLARMIRPSPGPAVAYTRLRLR